MDRKKLILLGGGHFAKQLLGGLLRLPNYEVIGYLDDNDSIQEIMGIKRLGKIFPIPENLPTKNIVIGIGHVGKVATRKNIIKIYKEAGFLFETIICPTAAIMPYNLKIGKGVYIGDFAILSPNVTIGDFAIINNTACVNEGVSVGENTHIASGVMISGNVSIGNDCMIGTGAAILQGVRIEDDCLIGMGTSVIKHCKKGTIYSIVSK